MPNRRNLIATVAAASLVAIALGSVVGVRLSNDPRPPAASADGSADHDAPAGDSPADTGHRPGTKQKDAQGKGGDSGTGSAVGEGGSESLTPPSSGAAPEPGRATDGVVVMPEAPGPDTGSGLPGLEEAAPTPSPTPYARPAATAFAKGRLVAGYPADLLPAAPRSAIVSSSVAPSSDRAQVALVGRRSTSPAAVLSYYRGLLGQAGFRPAVVRTVGGAQAAAFRRGPDRVVVTIDPDPAVTYSVYATLAVSAG